MRAIRIMFVAANPSSRERLLLDREFSGIIKQVRLARYRDSIRLDAIWATSPLDLLCELNDSHPVVVHFAGHGKPDGILLVSDSGGEVAMSGAGLRELFAEFPTIKLVLLNACHSEEIAREIVDVVGCVIGMSAQVGDEAARAFSVAFYAALGAGRSVESAFNQASVVCKLKDQVDSGRDVVCAEGTRRAQVQVLHHRADIDPDRLYLLHGAQPSAQAVRPRFVGATRVIAAMAMAVSIVLAATRITTTTESSTLYLSRGSDPYR